jgi:3-hydroxyacyl-CoA dehydrogenase
MSVSSIAVVGAGPRGLSIAEAAAEADMPVTVYCVTAARREHARRRLERTTSLRVDVGEISRAIADEILANVSFTRDLAEATEADLVIESAVGDVRARRALLATIEMRLSRGSVLASNATRAQLGSLAEVLVRQDQFLGLRFFHPATHTPLVELMPLPETAPGAVGACQAFCRWLRKTPVERVDGEVRAVQRSELPKAAGGRR